MRKLKFRKRGDNPLFLYLYFVKELIKKILKEEIKDNKVVCDSCGWSWNLKDGGQDQYLCHQCGYDNKPITSNLDKVIYQFKENLPKEYQNKLDAVKSFIVNYISKNGYNVKFLKSCSTGFSGVRTKDQIIICSPNHMQTLGDFLYVIFHEIRHEQQMGDIKMPNPLNEFDLEDFERIYEQYWEMELDSDQFAKNMIAKIIIKLNIPLDVAKKYFGLSKYIEEYPLASQRIKSELKIIVDTIKIIKKSGGKYEDIQDHPIVKPHLDKLENLF